MYDYNFVSRVNRALDLYPEQLHNIFEKVRTSGTEFQRAYLCGLIEYCNNKGKNLNETMPATVLSELAVPDIVKAGYDDSKPIPEFQKFGVYVTKVGWL